MTRKRVEEFIEEAKAAPGRADQFDLEGKILHRKPGAETEDESTLLDEEFLYFTTNSKDWIKIDKSLIKSIIPISMETYDEFTEYRAIIELHVAEDCSGVVRALYELLKQVAGNLYDLSSQKQAGTINWWRDSRMRREVAPWIAEMAPRHPSGDFSAQFVDPNAVLSSFLCSHRSCCAGCSSDCPRPTRTKGCPTKAFCTGKKAC